MSNEPVDTNKTTPHLADIAPLSREVRARNEFTSGAIFPFKSWQSIPSFPVVLTNMTLSSAALFASAAGLFITAAVFLPLGVVKSIGSTLGSILGGGRSKGQSQGVGRVRRRCVVINGASSGIGAALVHEYATPNTHLVLIARSEKRLELAARDAETAGATTSIHTLDFFNPNDIDALRQLVFAIDREFNGIDIALSVTGISGHRSDVVGREEAADLSNVDPEIRDSVAPMETGLEWGPATAQRMLDINVRTQQTFILTNWELMKARRSLKDSLQRPPPKIVVLASSAAFFAPANFALYAAAKSYLYSLCQSLQVLSAPYGIQITTVTPGFIESGMTHSMLQDGATVPVAMLGDPGKIAKRIRKAEERQERVVVYPLSQVLPLFGARSVNPLLEILGSWVGAASGSAAWVLS